MTAKQIEQTRVYFDKRADMLQNNADAWKLQNGGHLKGWQKTEIEKGIKDIEIYNKLVAVIDSLHSQLETIDPDFDLKQNPKYMKFANTERDFRDTILDSLAVSCLHFYKATQNRNFFAEINNPLPISENFTVATFISQVLEEMDKYLELNPDRWTKIIEFKRQTENGKNKELNRPANGYRYLPNYTNRKNKSGGIRKKMSYNSFKKNKALNS